MSIALVLDGGLTTVLTEGATHRRWRCAVAFPKAAVRDRPVRVVSERSTSDAHRPTAASGRGKNDGRKAVVRGMG